MLKSWKGFSARQINKARGKTGEFWMRESFDRVVRNRSHLRDAVAYVMDNPKMGGLKNWRWCGVADGAEKLWQG